MYHPSVVKYRLMKEFGWSPNQIAELDAKLGSDLVHIIKIVDSMQEEEVRRQQQQKNR
jgi:hypothetical protein